MFDLQELATLSSEGSLTQEPPTVSSSTPLPTPGTSFPPLTTSEILRNSLADFPRAFKCVHCNVQSLSAHFDEFQALFSDLTFDAILVSETWLKPSLSSNIFLIPGYTLIRNDRINKRGGGVGIFIKGSLKYKLIAASPAPYNELPEYLLIEVDMHTQKLLLGVIYKPPRVGHFSDFENDISAVIHNYPHTILMGDLNTNLLAESYERTKLLSLLSLHNLSVCPLDATHHTATSHTLLDIIATSNPDKVLTHGQLPAPGLSHHDLIFLSYSLRIPRSQPKIITYRDLKHINNAALMTDAAMSPWHEIEYLQTVDEKVAMFNNLLTNLYDKHAPVITRRATRPPSPWLDQAILTLMAQRDKAYRKYRCKARANSLTAVAYFEDYKRLRNRCTQDIRKAKRKYAYGLLSLRSTPANLWKGLRNLGVGNKMSSSSPDISPDELNIQFSQLPVTINDSTKRQTLQTIESSYNADTDKFYFRHIIPSEVNNAIKNIKTRAVGNDNISIYLINLILPFILDTITNIFNYSLQTGIFPTAWKSAIIRPLSKISNPISANDYRPISILPILSKALESLVHNQICNYVNKKGMLNMYQSGFRPKHSTCTALLNVTDDIRLAMDKRQLTFLVLLDFSKAFDTVDYDILLAKLTYYFNFSFSSVNWFRSYLHDRIQSVLVEKASSTWRSVHSGVPQGSILGPLLFSLYINHLPSCLSYSRFHLYADDLQIYISFKPREMNISVNKLNLDLKAISEWARCHGLKINPNKSQAILIGTQKLVNSVNIDLIPNISLNDTVIALSKTVKNLGIYFDENLSWTEHVSHVYKKTLAALHSLKRLKFVLPESLKISLVQSLIFPHFDYCDAVYSDISLTLGMKLQRLQNSCVRFIFNLKYFDHVSTYYTRLRWLRLNDRRKCHNLILLYKVLSSSTPIYLSSRFVTVSSHHRFNTRSQSTSLLSIPLHSSTIYSKSFTLSASREWNLLDGNTRNSVSLSIFRNTIINSLLVAQESGLATV